MRQTKLFTLLCATIMLYSVTGHAQEPQTIKLIKELSFGDKDLPDEYLLAEPGKLVVDNAGNIMVFDEFRIKMFDPNGKPKMILGRRGQGPGEFPERFIDMYISPEGYLSAGNHFFSGPRYKNIYNSRYELVAMRRIYTQVIKNFVERTQGYISTYFDIVECFPLNEKEIIYIVKTKSKESEDDLLDTILLQTGDNSFKIIAHYKDISHVSARGTFGGVSGYGMDYIGRTEFTILPDNIILYTHTTHDVVYQNGKATLTFHLYSIKNNTTETFTYTYSTKEIPKKYIDNYKSTSKIAGTEKKITDKVKETLRQHKYNALFIIIFSDKQFVFLFDNKSNTFLVFDTAKKQFIGSFLFPQDINITQIKNGKIYRIKSGSDIFPTIERYRIEPAIYGK